ncbi:MAG TPA: DUF2341 domain-containing protein [Flavobacteriales bacterium]|nr:DUF2341 domain-containing protein [Flavobacteriales bacterium]
MTCVCLKYFFHLSRWANRAAFNSSGKQKLILFFSLCLFFVSSLVNAAPPGYNYYKLLTTQENQITAGTGSLVNFPVLVRLTDNDLRHTTFGGYVQHISGYDIIFTSSDGTTVIPHQLEKYNSATGELVAWVNVPSVSSTVNTNFYMYFGNSSAVTDPSSATTWNPNYVAVWHLHNDILDATSNGVNLTNVGTTDEASAVAANGQDIEFSQALTHPSNPLMQILGNVTLETWVNLESALQGGPTGATENILLAQGRNSEVLAGNYCFSLNYIGPGTATPNHLRFYHEFGPGNDINVVSTAPCPALGTSAWHHVAAVRNTTSLDVSFYFDGVLLGTAVTYAANPTGGTTTTFSLGRDIASAAFDIDADFDEARISNTLRSPEWIQATYQNTMPGSTFLTVTETRCVFSDFAIAGADQVVCTNSTTLGATPLVYGTGAWSLLSGAGFITAPGSPTSTVIGLGPGTNVFVWTVTNSPFPPCAGFSDTVVITRDNIPPVVVCPPTQNVFAGAACTYTLLDYTGIATITDNCGFGGLTIVQSPAAGAIVSIGTTNVTLTATDQNGNTTSCTFAVNVTDNSPPVFTSCPSSTTVLNNPGACGAIVSWANPTATDNCSGFTLTQTAGLPSGSLFPIGVTTVTFTATDASSNTTNCTFTVTVTDAETPVFTSCPTSITVPNDPGQCTAVVSWAAPSATDNCPGLSLVQTAGLPSGSAFPTGVTPIVFTATDVNGNVTTCSFNITVVESTAPVFATCPLNITIPTSPGLCTGVATWTVPTATDNCPGVVVTQTAGPASGSVFSLGTTNIVYTATDAAGNTSTCSFTVTVNDNQFPTFTFCPPNISVVNTPGLCGAVVSWVAPTANDNCTVSSLTQTSGLPSGSFFPIGTSTIVFTATDATGNATACSFTITVSDGEVPSFTSCPANITVSTATGLCSAPVSWVMPTATDNCGGVTVTQSTGLLSGSAFPQGVTTVTYTATDAVGNVSTCSFTVTVNDNEAPVFTSCPLNITVNNTPGTCGAVVSWVAPVASENCAGLIVTQTVGLASGSVFPVGVSTISYTATDAVGNTALCTFTITVIDNQLPVFTSCPLNISVPNTSGACNAIVSWLAPVAIDNCTGTVITQTAGLASGSAFPIGITPVSFTATDASGNTSVCTFNVTVTDNEFPVFSSCPLSITLPSNPGVCGAFVSWAAPLASDNCGAVTITQVSGLPSGSTFPIGVTNVSFSATDVNGNTSFCSFTVTVNDAQAPAFTSCPANITVNNNPGLCSAIVSWVAPAATDNCAGLVINQTAGLPSGSAFPIGTTTVTFTATDASSNVSTCSFTVTVTDNQLPVFTSCPASITVNNNPGSCNAVVSWPAPTASDNCGGLTLTQTSGLPSGAAFPIGVSNVIFTATDASGNSATCSFTVTVTDNESPVFTSCPPNVSVNNNPGLCSAVVSWVAPVASDNCAGTVITQTAGLPSGSAFPIGVTNVSFTATDAYGNSSVCSFSVTVTDNQVPVFTSCPVNIIVSNTPGVCSAIVNWVAPAASDNCAGLVLAQTSGLPSGSSFPVGVSNIVFTATDANGNSSLCSFTVTVIDDQTPVFVSCPANIVANAGFGICNAIVSWPAPVAGDNCSGTSLLQTSGPVSGSSFPIGVTTIAYTATDASGNTAVCTFTVTVVDDQVPVFTSCPVNITVASNPGLCSAVVSWTAPAASDNCSGLTLVQTSGLPSGSTFPVGTTPVVFTATDASGNVALCSFNVTVTDAQAPVFSSCPVNISVNNTPGLCSAVVTWIAPAVTDNCAGVSFIQTAGLPSGSSFPIGTTTIVYTATDASGNTATCSFLVTVTDNQAPTFTSCPSNIITTNNPGVCGAVVSWPAPAASDNCAGLTVLQTLGAASGSSFPIGTTTISYTATDAYGNTSVCSFTVTVTDVEAPVFSSCPPNILLNNSAGLCSAIANWTPPAATDNCAGVVIAQTSGLPAGSAFPVGVTNVVYTATDIYGLTSTCSFTVTVVDNQLPLFTSCPSNIAVTTAPGSCTAVVSWVAPMASDNCPGIVLAQTSGLPNGSVFPIGVTTISYTATDASGNSSLCTFTITVTDLQAPIFTSCPLNISVNNTPGNCSAIVSWPAPVATDNCAGLVVAQTAGFPSGSTFPIGTTTITYTAVDASGNSSVCSFTVTVTDNELPVFSTCPANISTNTSAGTCGAVVTWPAPAATDNCSGLTLTQTSGLTSGSLFPIGITTVSFLAVDASGNSATCSFTITVTDVQPPVFTSCPSNITVNNTPGLCSSVVTWVTPTASDNCPAVSVVQTGGLVSGSAFPIGTSTVTFTASDSYGNTAICSFTVTVVDNQFPVFISCPANITVNNTPGSCSAVVSWVAPVASDNCGGMVLSQTAGLPSGSSFPIGITNIVYTATDASGNATVCAFTVTVVDNQIPVFTSCPLNIAVNNTPGSCGAVVFWPAPVANDNCGGLVLTQTTGLPSGSSFPIGTTSISYTATDISGNVATCSFTVTVTDNELPAFTSCPANITMNNTPGICGAVVNWVAPAASDNCPGLSIIQTSGLPSGSTFPVGVTLVTFIATDANGNSATCSFSVTIIDNQSPVFTSCPGNITVNNTPGSCSSVVTWVAPAASDNCGGVSVVQTAGLPSGSSFPIGTSTIAFTATDINGNTSVCTFTVNVIDNQFPTFTSCPSSLVISNTPGICGAFTGWVAPAATDNCPGVIITQTAGLPSGSLFPVGVTNITYTATDASGNVTLCSFTVTIVDNQIPVFTSCPSNISVNNAPGVCGATVFWPAPIATDNCAGMVVTQTAGLPSGSVFPIGTTTVSFTATDASGNSSICSFTVTVTDNELPVFTSCPVNILVNNTTGICGAVVNWVAPSASDNCPGVSIAQTGGLPSGSTFPIGTTNIAFVASDVNGNTATCTFTVTVVDNQSPVFTSCPTNITVNNTPGLCSSVVTWVAPSASDNCPGVSIVQTAGAVSGSAFPIGTTTISFTASDSYGNNSVCSFTVTVVDNQFPVFSSCPSNITVNNTPGSCSAVVSWVTPVGTDNCGGMTLTQTAGLPSGSTFPIGLTTISYTATDASGNSTLCTFSVTVVDNQVPVFTSCPLNIAVNNTPGSCGAVVFWPVPVATDNCAGIVVVQTSGLPSGSSFPIGVTTISYTATDASGNSSVCSFTVTVTDNELPVFTSCPINVLMNNTPGICGAVVNWIAPAASDNCAGLVVTQTSGLPSGSTFPVGVTLVTFIATDASGNSATCSFSVTITDNQSPVFTSCPVNITVNNAPGSCGSVVTWVAPVATDNCPGLSLVHTTGLSSGSTFPIGTSTITYTATDASGNSSVCSFTVTVVDNEFPVFTSCPTNITVNNTPGSCSANVLWTPPAATDNCPGMVLGQTAGLPSGSAFPIGTTTNTFRATDASGNSTLCTFTVTVIDNQVPVFTSCPSSFVLNANPGLCSAIASWAVPVATDNCGGMVINQTAGLANGSAFPIGVTTVSYVATDASGNTTTCTFTVTVIDNQAPVFVSCPATINTNTSSGICSAIVSWAPPSATDNCSGVVVTQTIGPPSGSVFPIGTTNISYTATDANGNTTLCAFSVIVSDNEAPLFTSCPANISLTTTPGVCTSVATWSPPTATDNCTGVVAIVQTAGLPSGSSFPLGVTLVTFTATDGNGNTSTCSFTVTVSDNQPPVFVSCPANITVANDAGVCGATVTWTVPTATDNCTGVIVTQVAGLPSGSVFPIGVTTITYNALDAGGNSVLCSFTVSVTDAQVPVFTSCPPNIVLNNNPGLCSAVASWVAPTASDNCAGLSIIQTAGLPSGSSFPVGVTTITYAATDAAGNSAMCSFTVTVSDNQAPLFTTCPSNIVLNNDPGFCSAIGTWIAPAATDNCGVISLVQTAGFASGSAFPVGVSTVTYTATDAAGNSTLCTFTVTVNDNQPPVYSSCPSNILVNNDAGTCAALVSWTPPVAGDNCPGVVTLVQTAGLSSGSLFPIGVTNISYNAIDVTGNISVCAFTVTVVDNQLPVFTSCPSSIVLNNTPGLCSSVASWIAPTASDNCLGTVITQTTGLPSGSVFPVGVTTISYTATDASGNVSVCTFTVTVNDNQVPIFTSCPSSTTVINNPGLCGAIVTWVAPAVSDNCSGVIITQTAGLPSGSLFPVGTTPVSFTATDAGGNTATCSFVVTVTDNQNPVFVSCPPNIVSSNTPGSCSAVINWVNPTASDNCAGVTVIQTAGPPNGSVFPIGVTTITYTATDAAGNSAVCSFTVTVNDAEAPIFTSCPVNINVSNTVGSCSAIVSWVLPLASDNCPGVVTVTQTSGLPSGSSFPIGSTTISYLATDVAGNTAICSFTVTVSDNELPVFSSCPANITINNNPGLCSAIVSWAAPSVSDNCAGVSFVQTAGLPSGSAFPVGVTTVVYTATDAAGNTSTCSFTVTVIDNQLPVFTSCPLNIIVNNSPGLCSAIVSWIAPSATDNCAGTLITLTSGLPSGSAFPVGTTLVTFTATDASGNSSTCNFTVTVNDIQPPVFVSCPSNIIVNNDAGNCSAVVNWVLPAATDNCSGVTVTQTAGLPNGSVFPLGTTNIVYTCTDASGLTANCSFSVTVTDNEAPVFVSCPVNFVVNNTPGLCSGVASWAPPLASDNCPGIVTITQTTGLPSGSAFPIGVTNITYTATDALGNTSICSFSVTVVDAQFPVFAGCPSNIAVSNTVGSCGATVTWIAPTASDNCPGTVLTQTTGLPSGSVFPIGVTTINYTATDAGGNVSTCSFTITVTDVQVPVFSSCPVSVTVNNNPGVCGAVVSWGAPTANDNCPGLVITQTAGLISGSTFPIGTTNVSYTATDASGNTAVCSFTVTVNDNEVPVFASCPSNIAVNNTTGFCSAIVSWLAPAATDNCPGVSIVQTAGPVSGSAFPLGTTNVSFTATDASGNVAVCNFTVTVSDNELPVFASCPVNIVVNNDAGSCGAVVNWTLPVANDNCSIASLVQTAGLPNGSVFPIGVSTINYTATDASGNSSICSFTITVNDNELPVFASCPVNISVNNSPGFCSEAVNWIVPVATDNCPGVSIVQTSGLASGSSFPIGVTLIGYTATDAVGNTSVCSFTITVTDNEAPAFVSCPSDITVVNDAGICGATVSWAAPTASDNCAGLVLTQTAGLSSGSVFPIGTTNVIYTATDAVGNATTCSFIVTVNDTELPVIIGCPNDTTSCDPFITFITPGVSDNCGGATIAQTAGLASGSTFPLGTTTVEFTATDANGNTQVCQFNVTILAPVVSQFTSAMPDTMCVLESNIDLVSMVLPNAGATDFFTVSAGGVIPVSWQFSPSLSGPGTYDIVHFVDNGVCTDSSSFTLVVVPVANALWTYADTVCEAGAPVVLMATGDPGGIWTGTGVTGNTFDPAAAGPGVHSISYIVGFGICKDTLTRNIYVSPDVDPTWAFATPSICTSSGAVSLDPLVTGDVPGTWSGAGVTGNVFDPASLTGLVNVTYTVGESFCAESLTQSINVLLQPVTFAGNDTAVCGLVDTLNASALIGNGVWSTGAANISIADTNNANSQITSTIEGTFMLVWTESVGGGTCIDKDTVYITFWELPTASAGPDQSIEVTNAVFAANNPPFGTGTWIIQNAGSTVVAPNNPVSQVNNLVVGINTFTWSVANGTCPPATDDVIITVNDVVIPQGISPNGDGINDVWMIGGIATIKNELQIFTRWGEKVYETENYKNDWAGTKTNGSELPNDTYFYVLKVEGYEDFTGYIIIKR